MIDIVDTQLHLARGKIAATLEAMDALGIRSVLIDEFWGTWDSPEPTHIQPGYRLNNGSWRALMPTAQEASLLHPDRFSYLVRIDRQDPQLECVMRVIASCPNARAFRLQPVWTRDEAAALAAGAYDHLLAVAEDVGLPVCWFVPGYVELLAPYLKRFPKLVFVIDHCGIGFANIPPGRSDAEERRVLDATYFDQVVRLAEFSNAVLKWSHAQDRFGAPTFPYDALRPLLRQAIEAFGAARLMWASDKSVMFDHSWADLLYAVREDPGLSVEEKSAILGGTARRVFDWPAPLTASQR